MPYPKLTIPLLGIAFLIAIICICNDKTMTIGCKFWASVTLGIVPFTGFAAIKTHPDLTPVNPKQTPE